MSEHVFDEAKWQAMTIFARMGNIGSEVGRSAKAFMANDSESFDGAFRRTIDLFDATVAGLVRQRSCRVREVLLARDQFVAQYFGDLPAVSPGLEAYFMQFAVADRIKK